MRLSQLDKEIKRKITDLWYESDGIILSSMLHTYYYLGSFDLLEKYVEEAKGKNIDVWDLYLTKE